MSHTLQPTQKKRLTNLARKHKLDFVILYGSQAREERPHRGTDLDLAVYRRNHPLSNQELLELYAQFSLIFSNQELDLKSLHHKDPLFCYHVTKDGRLLITRKIKLIQRDLSRLSTYQQQTFEDVAQNWRDYAAVKNLLMEIVGRAIDINQHLIRHLSQAGNGSPTTYTESFLKLIELDVLSQNFGQKIAKSAGFRNAVVHGYDKPDQELVYRSIHEAIEQYQQYCQFVLKFIHKNK